MNHLFVTQDFGPDLGGMARRHVEICRRLRPDNVTVSTVAARDGGAFDRGEPYSIVRESFPFQRANRFVNQVRWARHMTALAHDADVIHCGNVRPVGYASTWTHRRTGTPYLLYVNGGDLLREERKSENAFKRATGARIFGAAGGIVATSAWVAELTHSVMNRLGVAQQPPVRALALGTDPAEFRPDADRGRLRQTWDCPDAPILLTVARLVPHKGQDVAMRALAALLPEFPALRYVLVGDGHDEPRLRALAEQLKIAHRVIFAGPLEHEELAEAYATGTIYLGLSRLDRDVNVEGFGISFLEASSSGLPIVAGASGGVASAVREGETGLLVPPTDVAAAAAAIRALLRDESLRRRLGTNGRRAVEDYFNWERVARDTREFAREIVAASGGSAQLQARTA